MRRKFGPVFEFSVQWTISGKPGSDSGLISWKPEVDQISPKFFELKQWQYLVFYVK